MPKIREYTTQTQVSQAPSGQRVDVERIGVGRGLRALGEGVGVLGDTIQKNNEQKDLSEAHAAFSKHRAEQTVKYDKAIRDGTLDRDKFLAEYDEGLSKLQETAKTKAGKGYFVSSGAELKGHFEIGTAKAQAHLAGERAAYNFNTAIDADTIAIQNDPSQYDSAKATAFKAIDENTFFSAEQKLKAKETVRTRYADTAIRKAIANSPDDAERQLKEGLWDTEIGDKQKYLDEVEKERNRKRVQSNLQTENLEKIRKEKAEVEKMDFLTRITTGKVNNIQNDILRATYMNAAEKEHYLDQIQKHSEGKLKTDKGTFVDIFHKIRNKEITTGEKIDTYVGYGLDFEDAGKLKTYLSGRRTPEGQQEEKNVNQLMKMAMSELGSGDLSLADPQRDTNVYAFQRYAMDELQRYKDAGKPTDELFDEKSPKFLGRNIKGRFGRTQEEIIKSLTEPTKFERTPEQQRKEGESIVDYANRMKAAKEKGANKQ